VFHYQGYQWRRKDMVTSELELGQKTFNFITAFNIPVISQLFRKNVSLENIFHLKHEDNVTRTMESKELGLPGFSITATVYLILFDDFGFYGVFIITFLFVGFTQKLYRDLFLKNHNDFWSIILFIAVYKLWMATFFNHHLTGAWFNTYLYPILIIETVNFLYKYKHRNLKYNEL